MSTFKTSGAWSARAGWLAIAGGIVAVLIVALGLDADPRGYGTHTQLGLPPCGFRLFTGLPCPGCGLTTSFVHGVHGRLVLSAQASPLGFAMLLSSVALVPVCLVAAFRGWGLGETMDRVALDRWAVLLAAGGLAAWLGKLAATV